jgi:TolA-binding protein
LKFREITVRNLSSTLAFCIGAVLLTSSVPLAAQSTATKVDRLEREVRALQRRVFGVNGSGGQPVQQQTVTSAPQNETTTRLIADMSVKISAVEKQLRILTGRLEELEYRQRQLEEALDAVQKDTDLKINDLKQSGVQAGGQSGRQAGSRNFAEDNLINNRRAADTRGSAASSTPAAPSIELPTGEPAVQYDYAFSLIRKNDLDSGLIAMEKFLKANPGDSRTGNAKYWLGRIHFLQDRPGQAAQSFLKLIEEHPNHPKRPDALVDLAETLIKLDSASDACNAISEFDRSASGASNRLRQRAKRVASQAKCG